MARQDVRMSEEEVAAFLAARYSAVLSTLGPDGYPHQVAMWYVPEPGRLLMWTFRRSQKARNLYRDARASLLVEDGEEYHQLRGVLVRADAELIEDVDEVRSIGLALAERYGARYGDPEQARAAHIQQAPKRVGIALPIRRVVSWDFGRLTG
jgi:PPOX class probable F420-dependent enzyme